jgi:hypothetical protein
MERRNRKEERERYYLLPGMGGKLFARKRRMIMVWTLLVGSLVSLVVAVILYYTHTGVRH